MFIPKHKLAKDFIPTKVQTILSCNYTNLSDYIITKEILHRLPVRWTCEDKYKSIQIIVSKTWNENDEKRNNFE